MVAPVRAEGYGSVPASGRTASAGSADHARPNVGWPVRSDLVPPLARGFSVRHESVPGLDRVLVPGGAVVFAQAAKAPGWQAATGKPQLAVCAAQSLRWPGGLDLVAWVTAASRVSVLSGYAEAAALLGLDRTGDAEVVAAWPRSAPRRWLVVLGDLRDPAALEGLWPAGASGRLLIMADDAEMAGGRVPVLPVGCFTAREAVGYLSERLSADPDHRGGQLELVGELAALAHASAVIEDSELTCRDYQEILQRRRAQLEQAGTGRPPAAAAEGKDGVSLRPRAAAGGLPEASPGNHTEPHTMPRQQDKPTGRPGAGGQGAEGAVPATRVGRARLAALAALAGRPGGMLIRELGDVLAGELRGQLRLAVQRGVRDGLIGYAPERDGRNGARAYRLTPAGREAASRAGEPDPAPQPPKAAPRHLPGSRGHAILALLEGGGDGMTCREIITASGGAPSRGAQNHYNDSLRAALSLGYVRRRRERRADAHGRGRETWVWQVTQEGAGARARASSPPAPAPSAPAKAPKAPYAWAAGAAARHGQGESVRSIAVSLGVSGGAVKRALEARGVTIVPNSRVQPPWAAQAAQRYEAGESCRALARGHDVPDSRMSAVLKRAGVTLRDRKAAAMIRQAARGRPGPEPAEPARPEGIAPARAAIPSPGAEGEVTWARPDARTPQINFMH